MLQLLLYHRQRHIDIRRRHIEQFSPLLQCVNSNTIKTVNRGILKCMTSSVPFKIC